MNLDEFRTWAELKKLYHEVQWIVPGWLPQGYVTMLAADPGVGKSFLALSVCKSILSGGRFYDGQTLKQTTRFPRVLWVEAEAGEPFHMQRAANMGINPLQMIEPRRCNEDSLTPSLSNARDRETIAAIMAHEDIAIVVVDSLSAATSGVDENSAAAGQAVQWLAEQARNTNKPVLLIHHMNKSTMRIRGTTAPTLADIRGSTAITQHARVVWTLDNPDESQPQLIRLACAKSNIGVKPDPILLQIHNGQIVNRIHAVEPHENAWWKQ